MSQSETSGTNILDHAPTVLTSQSFNSKICCCFTVFDLDFFLTAKISILTAGSQNKIFNVALLRNLIFLICMLFPIFSTVFHVPLIIIVQLNYILMVLKNLSTVRDFSLQ